MDEPKRILIAGSMLLTVVIAVSVMCVMMLYVPVFRELLQGDQGLQGETGPIGPPGIQGPGGRPGLSVAVEGALEYQEGWEYANYDSERSVRHVHVSSDVWLIYAEIEGAETDWVWIAIYKGCLTSEEAEAAVPVLQFGLSGPYALILGYVFGDGEHTVEIKGEFEIAVYYIYYFKPLLEA